MKHSNNKNVVPNVVPNVDKTLTSDFLKTKWVTRIWDVFPLLILLHVNINYVKTRCNGRKKR